MSDQLLWIARFDYRGGLRVVEHAHTFHQCLLVLRGEAEVRLDGGIHRLNPHDFLWLPPGFRHGWSVDPEEYLETFDMKFSVTDPGVLNSIPALGCVHPSRQDLETPFRALYACARSTPENRDLRCSLMLRAFLLQVPHPPVSLDGAWEIPPSDSDTPGVVHILERLFAEAPNRKWTASEIAARVHLSYRRISQLCQEQKQQTPMQMLREARIRKARELLCYGDVAVKEVADLTGFESLHHFSRCFKQTTGMSPAAWRKRERNKSPASIQVSPGFHNRIRIVDSSV